MGKFMWGAFLGSVAGGITALMFTKKTGQEMRDDLSKKYVGAKATSEKFLDELNVNKKDFAKKAKALAHDAQLSAERILKEAQQEGRRSIKEMKSKKASKPKKRKKA